MIKKKKKNVTSAIANKAAFLYLHLGRREMLMQLCADHRAYAVLRYFFGASRCQWSSQHLSE